MSDLIERLEDRRWSFRHGARSSYELDDAELDEEAAARIRELEDALRLIRRTRDAEVAHVYAAEALGEAA